MVARQYKKLTKETNNIVTELSNDDTEGICCNTDHESFNIINKSKFSLLASSDNESDNNPLFEQVKCEEDDILCPVPKKNLKNNSKKSVSNYAKHQKEFKREIRENLKECCLRMNKSSFDCDNEISSIFGSRIVEQTMNRKHMSLRNKHLNMKHYFVKGDPKWPHLNRNESGIIMNYIEEKNEFTISFDIGYIKKKEIFDVLVNSMLLDDIFVFMEKNPFFFNGLIKLAEISMLRNEHENTFNFLQKAIYVFESSLNPFFSPFTYYKGCPRTHINSSEIESRDIYITIGYYMNCLGFRGLFRTALEYCILLISMDIPHDRFHSLLHIDYFAISSSSIDIFIDVNNYYLSQFYNLCTWNSSKIDNDSSSYINCDNKVNTPLCYILPNFSFGIPLSLYMKYVKNKFKDDLESVDNFIAQIQFINMNQILDTEYNSDNTQNCSIYLLQSLLVFPEFILFFIKKLNKGSSKQRADDYNLTWDKINEFFLSLLDKFCKFGTSENNNVNQYPYLLVGRLLVEANVEKCFVLWKKTSNIKWLHFCSSHLCKLLTEGETNQKNIENFINNRRSMLMRSRFNIFRYLDVSVSEFSENPTLPAYFRSENNELASSNTSQNFQFGTLSLNSDPIFVFFQSLLPWYTHYNMNTTAPPLNIKELATDCFISLRNYIKNNIIVKSWR
ncbi:hypothetical protein FG386_000834 [Cryptosporidium ryanae]|uniref:uncharacterized protein n=1 Tax=Cryptosporidium ryanae TaxID=515981 RepID=UPI00351A0742|nr:hypothetical protein FG386_000834 [Cryptosporidium ryanae]